MTNNLPQQSQENLEQSDFGNHWLRKSLARMGLPVADFFEDNFFPMLQESSMRGVRIYTENNHMIVEAPMPGLQSNDIEVDFDEDNSMLLIRGKREDTEGDKKRRYYRSSKRSYSCSIALPKPVDRKQEPQASYKDGILTVTMNLAKNEEKRKIAVRDGNSQAQGKQESSSHSKR